MKDLLPNSTMKRINLIIPEFLYKWIGNHAEINNISIRDMAELEMLAAMIFRISVAKSVAEGDDKNNFSESAGLIMHRMDSICPSRAAIIMGWARKICMALESEKS